MVSFIHLLIQPSFVETFEDNENTTVNKTETLLHRVKF